ncbi:heme exporter protein CcmB [Membranihabitans maritimus]|uniref:heme exporter protein CcmB n=1 Tax=Membranihabitans maritimus TaxID=2904244 RepID=UPI001F27D556|nr:hypothetical protein [Membranihabitans maritimus]
MKSYFTLVKNRWQRDRRDIGTLLSTLQYLLAATFIVYLIFRDLSAQMWLSLYWIIAIFSLINASSTALKSELKEHHKMLFQLVEPEVLLFSRLSIGLVKNTILLVVLWGLMSFFFGQVVQDFWGFSVAIVLAALNFSAITHLVNAIAYRSEKSQSLYPVLSLPVIIPVVLELYNIGAIAVDINPVANDWGSDALILGGLGLAMCVASLFLFPYLWTD